MWNRKVFIRIIEVLLCVACVVALRVTDDESRRVFHYLRNRSREWSLLNNVTWGAIGAALATVTCGGYVIVTVGLLVAAATGELKGRKTELFLLGLGIILFAIVGALSLASIESVPEDLIDNAAVLGALCLLTALVFIADLLMTTSQKKEKPVTIQLLDDKNAAKRQITATLATENESKTTKPNSNGKSMERNDNNDKDDTNIDRTNDSPRSEDRQDRSEDSRKLEETQLTGTSNQYPHDDYIEDRNRNYGHVERDLREYTQNVENERALRDSQRYRDSDMQRNHRDSYDPDHRMMYRKQDIYQRPVDEVDTPRFPTEVETRAEPVFAKIVNPSVKIMRVERDAEADRYNYRYSDTSQYDNVPSKLRAASAGILKKGRDVAFKARNPRGHGQERGRDEIEMLEECFGVLRTTSTGTQTGTRIPSSPNDPGYVRHTVNNWPQELKTKTPGSSPDHSRHD